MTPPIHPHWRKRDDGIPPKEDAGEKSWDPQEIDAILSNAEIPGTETPLQASERVKVPVHAASEDGRVIPKGKGSKIRVQEKPRNSAFFNILFGLAGISAIAFLFVKGVSFIQADLSEGLTPDHRIEITDTGFGQISVDPGDVVEFVNKDANPERMRTEERNDTGKPLLETKDIPPEGTVRLQIPTGTPGMTLHLVSVYIPSKKGILVVSEEIPQEEAEEARAEEEENEVVEENADQVPAKVTVVHSPAAITPSVTPPATEIPSPPSLPPQPQSPPVMSIGEEEFLGTQSSWPALLRINTYTVGNNPIPTFIPVTELPVHVIRKTEEQIHSAAPQRYPVRRQPTTGPAVWVLGLISAGLLPFCLRKKKA